MTIEPRNDVKPFSDIRVRKAMQMAINLPAIAKDYYKGTVEPYPVMLTSRYMKGWGFRYEDWPQDLKNEYAYNPAAAKQLLAQAGYPDGFKTNVVTDKVKSKELLQIVRSYFAAVGIDMEIRMMDTTSFIDLVMHGKKHDQMVHCSPGPLGHSRRHFWN
jgi:peptide/nickel transport system substrate-binding protein